MPTLYDLTCEYCHKTFQRPARQYYKYKKNIKRKIFCSDECSYMYRNTSKDVNCSQCGKTFKKIFSQFKRYKHHFCSRSCSATYNNLHKTKGNRRSKLEIWLEEKLPSLYPNLQFKFNSKEEINSELDIYIPSLKLAFELNGIYHYEPIHGVDKFNQIQNNDNRKFQACIEKGIDLCIIDTSSLNYFKEQNANKYLDIITNIINKKN
jgi:hypothetical protein